MRFAEPVVAPHLPPGYVSRRRRQCRQRRCRLIALRSGAAATAAADRPLRADWRD
jgi:hypothetical protein